MGDAVQKSNSKTPIHAILLPLFLTHSPLYHLKLHAVLSPPLTLSNFKH